MTSSLDARLSEAKKSHVDIKRRHKAILRDFEAIKSEMNLSHRFITLLEQQKASLEEENKRLKGLMHPVRSCPEDVLRHIFEWTIMLDPKHQFRRATCISQVCQRWRKISLNMGSLWTQVAINFNKDEADVREFLARSKQRLRNIPPKITIVLLKKVDNSSKLENFIRAMWLDRFNAIDSLEIQLSDLEEYDAIRSPTLNYHGRLNKLIVSTFLGGTGDGDGVAEDISFLLSRFPRCKSLALLEVGMVDILQEGYLSGLQCLKLDTTKLDEASTLSRLTGLQELTFSFSEIQNWDDDDEIQLTSLRKLRVTNVDYFPWSIFKMPAIESLTFDQELNDEAVEFLRRHDQIQHLDVSMSESSFKTLAFTFPQLKSLGLSSFVSGIFSWKELDIHSVPFPSITALTIDFYDSDKEISEKELDGLVRERCPPRSELGDNGVELVKVLEFIDDEEGLEKAAWRKSELLRGCRQTLLIDGNWEDYDDRRILKFSWE